ALPRRRPRARRPLRPLRVPGRRRRRLRRRHRSVSLAVPGSGMSEPSAALEAELRALARRALGAEIAALEPLAGGLGHRRFYRLRLAGGALRSCVARVDRGEPAPGVPPEPPLEPTRAFLEAHGLPVPRRHGGAAGIDLL